MRLVYTDELGKHISPDTAFALGMWKEPNELPLHLQKKLERRLRLALKDRVNREGRGLPLYMRDFDYQKVEEYFDIIWRRSVPHVLLEIREMEAINNMA